MNLLIDMKKDDESYIEANSYNYNVLCGFDVNDHKELKKKIIESQRISLLEVKITDFDMKSKIGLHLNNCIINRNKKQNNVTCSGLKYLKVVGEHYIQKLLKDSELVLLSLEMNMLYSYKNIVQNKSTIFNKNQLKKLELIPTNDDENAHPINIEVNGLKHLVLNDYSSRVFNFEFNYLNHFTIHTRTNSYADILRKYENSKTITIISIK